MNKFVLIVVAFLFSINCLAQSVGDGAYNREFDVTKTRTPNYLTTSRLKDKRIDNPIIVQGKGRSTIVSGVRVINRRRITDDNMASMLIVKCPKRGGEIIIRDVRVLNRGIIKAINRKQNTQTIASPVVVDCSDKKNINISITDANVVNSGIVQAISY